jgi:hypothetical protein
MENAILQHRRERQVSLGMLQTSYLSFDMRGTECVGQTMFTMMIPVDQNVSNIFSADKHLQHQVFPASKYMFSCVAVLIIGFLTLMS